MSKSDPEAIFDLAPVKKATLPPFGLGLVLAVSDGLVLALLGWTFASLVLPMTEPLADDLARRALVTGLMLVPLVKSIFGIYSLGRCDLMERGRRSLQGALLCSAALLVPYIATEEMAAFFILALALALTGFVATFLADLLIVQSVLVGLPQWRTPVVIIGAGRQGAALAEKLHRLPWLGMRPVCFFDEDETLWHNTVAGVPVAGPVSLLKSSPAYAGLAHTAIIAEAGRTGAALADMVRQLPFRQVYCVVGEGTGGLEAQCHDFNGVLAMRLGKRQPSGYATLRRAFDVALSGMLLLMLAPLMGFIALAIRLDSPGPALFRQERWAGGNRTFGCLKFRTMHLNAEAHLMRILESDPVLRAEYATYHKLTVDPRITRVGRLLRKTSLDELPQLWNVLVGQMSLIGPRAYIPRELPEVGEAAAVIGTVRPGLTGYWQVSGRHRTTFQERVAMDVFYVRNCGLLFDFYILCKTAVIVLKGDGS